MLHCLLTLFSLFLSLYSNRGYVFIENAFMDQASTTIFAMKSKSSIFSFICTDSTEAFSKLRSAGFEPSLAEAKFFFTDIYCAGVSNKKCSAKKFYRIGKLYHILKILWANDDKTKDK